MKKLTVNDTPASYSKRSKGPEKYSYTGTCEKSIRYKQMCMYLVLDQLLRTTECMMTDRQTYSYIKEI